MSVTILMPVYNGATFLARSLKSIADQTFDDWHLVVGDDGSTDDSVAIIKGSGLPRVRVVKNPRNIGWAQTVNLLVAEASTPYVAMLHADDWWEPDFLKMMVGLLDRAPGSMFAVSAARIVHPTGPDTASGLHLGWPAEMGSSCPSSVAVSLLLQRNWVRIPAVLARTELYRRYALDESLPYACDWLMWLRAAAMASVEVTHEMLANFQVHEQSQTTGFAKANLTTIEMLRMIQVLTAEWAGHEPVKDAIRGLTAGVTNEILADAGLKIEAGDLDGAAVQLRFARAIAPDPRQAVLSLAGQTAVGVLRLPMMARLRIPITQAGRRIW